MLILLGILGYITCMALFSLWDALIGFPVDFNGENNPPAWFVGLAWPIAIPVLLVIGFEKKLSSLREKRIKREQKKERLRIVVEREAEKQQLEEEKLMQEVEAELEHETKNTHAA